MHRKMTVSLNCPAESCEQCGVRRPCFPNRNLISPWPSVWHPLFLDKVFWCPHGNESNFLLPCPSKTFLGTSDSMRPSLSSALERYKYPGTVPGTFRRGLGFIFYLVALRETCQGDQAERGVLLVKPLSQVKDWAFFFYLSFFLLSFYHFSLKRSAEMTVGVISSCILGVLTGKRSEIALPPCKEADRHSNSLVSSQRSLLIFLPDRDHADGCPGSALFRCAGVWRMLPHASPSWLQWNAGGVACHAAGVETAIRPELQPFQSSFGDRVPTV